MLPWPVMMKCSEIIKALEKRWNSSYALEWDNVGLLVGREEKEISTIFVALDVTDETLDAAIQAEADLMITHHPLLFSPVKKINSGDFIGRRLIKMIQHDLCYYAMHTNFDVLGMAELNRSCLKLQEAQVLDVTANSLEEREEGIGRIGTLEEEMSLLQFATYVKEAFDIPDVRIYGDTNKKIKTVAVSSGSGKSMIKTALRKGADVLVTGDIDYHGGIDAVAQGMAVIDAGHYGTEYGFISYVSRELETMFPQLQIEKAGVHHPYQVL